ncbi:MAG: UvrB/UvrC motif-containing protein [Candidatus Brocadiia bacterium]
MSAEDEEEAPERRGPLCEECGEERATVHVTEFVDGEKVQRHLCEECYARQEGKKMVSPGEFFAQILAAVSPEFKELSQKTCPRCGVSYLEFRQRGVLGCPYDYEAFAEPLESLLDQVHGATRHCGKVPPQAGRQAVIASKLRSLNRKLERAVEREDYEAAARIRDRVNELESEQDEPGESPE